MSDRSSSATMPPLTGGCLCRRVRYEAAPDQLQGYYCHCRICRLAFGKTRATFINLRITQRWQAAHGSDVAPGIDAARRG